MLPLALASILLLDTPKLALPGNGGIPKYDPFADKEASPGKSLDLDDVNDLAKGWVKKPKAKLIASLGHGDFGEPGKADLFCVGGTVRSNVIAWSGMKKDVAYEWACVRLWKLKPGDKYVVVFKAKAGPNTGIVIDSVNAEATAPVGEDWSNVPIAFVPQKQEDWFQVHAATNPKTAAYVQLQIASIKVYSLE